jgi:hypothetical protein
MSAAASSDDRSAAEQKIHEEYKLLARTLEIKQPANDGSFSDFDQFMAFYISTPNKEEGLKEFLKEGWVNPVRNDYSPEKSLQTKLTHD